MEKRNFTDALKLTGVMIAFTGGIGLAALAANSLSGGNYKKAAVYGSGIAGIAGGFTYAIKKERQSYAKN